MNALPVTPEDAAAATTAPASAPLAPAGWYDDGSGRQRWFDGAQWTEQYAPEEPVAAVIPSEATETHTETSAGAVPSTRTYQPGEIVNGHQLVAGAVGALEWVPVTGANATGSGSPAKKSRRPLWITLGAVAGVLLLIGLVNGLNKQPSTDPVPLADTSDSDRSTPAPEPEPEMVAVPTGLVGMAASDAAAALDAVGLTAAYDGEATAKVLSVSPSSAKVEVGSKITLTVEQPPELTLAQKNAIGSAESYLDYTNFSRSGLIGQLEYEGFSTEDAAFAVDTVNPDWNAQAAGSAQSYLDYSSFSREGLYDQLIYEGFTPDQANAGLAAVGY